MNRSSDQGWVAISIQDSGIGITPEDLPKLFHEFARLDNARGLPTEGSGLGLALTKRLVELHGGQIFAASADKGHGSTFTIVLPVSGPGARK